jgi:hypothetical protein
MNKNISQAKFIISFASSCLLPDDSWYDCQRALMDESGVFVCRRKTSMVLHADISPRGWAIGGRNSETQSHPIDITIIIMESPGGMTLTGKNRTTRRKTCPSVNSFTTNPTWTDPSANPGLAVRGLRLTAWARLCVLLRLLHLSQSQQHALKDSESMIFNCNESDFSTGIKQQI